VIGCIVRGELFRGACDEVGDDGVDGDAFARYHDAGLTGRAKRRGGAVPPQAHRQRQGGVFLAEGAIRPDGEDALAAAFTAGRGSIGPVALSYVDQSYTAPRSGLHQRGKRRQARVQATDDVESRIGCRRQFRHPMRRKTATGRGNADDDRTGTARSGLLRRKPLQSQSDAAARQTPFADDIGGTPVLETERGLRRELVAHVTQKEQIGFAQPVHG